MKWQYHHDFITVVLFFQTYSLITCSFILLLSFYASTFLIFLNYFTLIIFTSGCNLKSQWTLSLYYHFFSTISFRDFVKTHLFEGYNSSMVQRRVNKREIESQFGKAYCFWRFSLKMTNLEEMQPSVCSRLPSNKFGRHSSLAPSHSFCSSILHTVKSSTKSTNVYKCWVSYMGNKHL